MHDRSPLRLAVIGGGISGLAAANHLVELDPSSEVILFESTSRLGGVLGTEHRGDLRAREGCHR